MEITSDIDGDASVREKMVMVGETNPWTRDPKVKGDTYFIITIFQNN